MQNHKYKLQTKKNQLEEKRNKKKRTKLVREVKRKQNLETILHWRLKNTLIWHNNLV